MKTLILMICVILLMNIYSFGSSVSYAFEIIVTNGPMDINGKYCPSGLREPGEKMEFLYGDSFANSILNMILPEAERKKHIIDRNDNISFMRSA